MDDLSSRILNADGMSEVEAILEAAFENVEFIVIGELDINEEALAKIGEVLCRECRFEKRILEVALASGDICHLVGVQRTLLEC